MARQRRPLVRGTRNPSGILSGVTLATNPSGVTIDQYGFPTTYGYPIANLTGFGQLVSGVSNWAGTTVTLVTGLTSIGSIIPSVINNGVGTYQLFVSISNINSIAGYASASLRYSLGTAGSSIATLDIAAGCSIAFMAFGT